MRLTRKQTLAITSALKYAERTQAYIDQADIAIARKGSPATTTFHYTRADGSTLYEVTKEYGSELCLLQNCIKELRYLIQPPKGEQE